MAYQRNQAAIEMLMPHSKDMEAHKQNYYALRSEIGARVTSMEAMSNSFVYEAPLSQIRHQAQFNPYLPTSPLTARPLQPPDPPDFPSFNGTRLSEWLNICEQIFDLHKIAPEQRTRLASHHMEGKALLWNREFMRCHYGRFPLWTDYIIALGAKFYEPYVKPMKSQCLFPSVTLIKSPPPTTPPEPPIINPSNKFSAIKATPETCNVFSLPNLLGSLADEIKMGDAKDMVKAHMIQHGKSSLDMVSSPAPHQIEEVLFPHTYEQDEDSLNTNEKHVDESELNGYSSVLNIRPVINQIEDKDNKKNQTSKDENGNNQDINKVTSHVPALESEEENKVFHVLQEETMEPKSKIGEKMDLDKTVYLAKQCCSSNQHGKLSTWFYEHEEGNMILQHWELRKRNVIHALGKRLPDFLLDSQHQLHLALRHVLYLKSLVDCGIWGFASDEMVTKGCQNLAIAEEYAKLLMNPCRRILVLGAVKRDFQIRDLVIPMLSFMVKYLDPKSKFSALKFILQEMGAEAETLTHQNDILVHIMKRISMHCCKQMELEQSTVTMVIKEFPKGASDFCTKIPETFAHNKKLIMIVHYLRTRFKCFTVILRDHVVVTRNNTYGELLICVKLQSKRLTTKCLKSWHFKFKMDIDWRLLVGIVMPHPRLEAEGEKHNSEYENQTKVIREEIGESYNKRDKKLLELELEEICRGVHVDDIGITKMVTPDLKLDDDDGLMHISSATDSTQLMDLGQMNRAMSSTIMNERRSERVQKSEINGDELKEVKHINKFLAVGNVISSVSQTSSHLQAGFHIYVILCNITEFVNDLRCLVKRYLTYIIEIADTIRGDKVVELTLEQFENHLASVFTYEIFHSLRPPEIIWHLEEQLVTLPSRFNALACWYPLKCEVAVTSTYSLLQAIKVFILEDKDVLKKEVLLQGLQSSTGLSHFILV